MLGEQVAEFNGQAVSTRVLDDIGFGPRTEVTDHQVGTLCGVQVESTVTYIGTLRPNGTLTGSGTGYTVTADGHTATFRGQGAGSPAQARSVGGERFSTRATQRNSAASTASRAHSSTPSRAASPRADFTNGSRARLRLTGSRGAG
jgi:hypothetical protein